jgi:hypothetical protein
MQVGSDVFLFHKEDKNAPIDELTKMKSFLGTEADLFMNWQVTSDMSVVVRYGVFFPGSAIVTDKDPRHFLYTGITLGL